MATPSRRYLSVWLPRLPTDRLLRQGRSAAAPGVPLVTIRREGGAMRLAAVDPVAAGRGLAPGLALADARARHPDLEAVDADPAADARFLEAIADWAGRWTPLVALDGGTGSAGTVFDTEESGLAGLMLDISGCAHLFGGEAALYRDVLGRLRAQRLHAAAGIADTPGAAWAVARFAPPTARIVPPGGTREALLPLPLAALRLPRTTLAAMRRVGLDRIGDIADLPRPPLAARFGETCLRRLDQAFGRLEEAISPRQAPPVFLAERRLMEPIFSDTAILSCIETLAAEMVRAMEAHGMTARGLELTLFRVDGITRGLRILASQPLRGPKGICALFADRLAGLADPLDPGFGFDVIRLAVTQAQKEIPVQDDLDPGGRGMSAAQRDEALARFVDHVTARFGPDRVRRIDSRDTHLPGHDAPLRPWSVPAPETGGTTLPAWPLPVLDSDAPLRPLRLLDPPRPVEVVAEVPDGPPILFRWQGRLYRITRSEGPERIASEWWWAAGPVPPTRDYFRVEDQGGRRFWLFRDGLWEREIRAGQPRWFLHGLFA